MQLETDRLIIRPPRYEDAQYAYEFRRNEKASQFVGGIIQSDFESFNKKFITFCDSYKPHQPYEYSIQLKSINRYIGYCGVQYCEVLKDYEILYGLLPHYWGLGYAYEAAREMLKFVFKDLNFDHIKAAVNPENPSSEKILKKIGLEFTGQIDWPGQGLVHVYGLTKDDYQEI